MKRLSAPSRSEGAPPSPGERERGATDLVADFYRWTQEAGRHGTDCPYGRAATGRERKERGCTCGLWDLEKRADALLNGPDADPFPPSRSEETGDARGEARDPIREAGRSGFIVGAQEAFRLKGETFASANAIAHAMYDKRQADLRVEAERAAKAQAARNAAAPSSPQTTPCPECKGRGWHPGDCHPREECGSCEGTGRAPQTTPAPEGTCAECGNVLPRAVKCVSCGAYNPAPRLSPDGAPQTTPAPEGTPPCGGSRCWRTPDGRSWVHAGPIAPCSVYPRLSTEGSAAPGKEEP